MISISKGTPGAGGSYHTLQGMKMTEAEQEKQEMIEDCNLVLNYLKLEASNEDLTVDKYIQQLEGVIGNLSQALSDTKAVKAFFEAQPQNACIHEFKPKLKYTIEMINEGEIA